MTTQGVLVVLLIVIGYLLWIVNLVRRQKLHAAYAVVWIFWLILGGIIIALPGLLDFLTKAIGAIFPVSALTLLAFGALFAMQIYLLSQLSILSRRISLIAQHIAIEDATKESQPE
jgi:hypothetical protein